MKKTLLIVTLLVLALGALGVGVVAAQGGQPPFGQRGVADGTGLLHDYMEKAMAEAVGLSVEEFEARHDNGETFYQIALAEGFTVEEIPALMQGSRNTALDAAAEDGVITQEQANWMKSRGFGLNGRMDGYGGNGNGTCPMFGGDAAPNRQPGSGFGPGQGNVPGQGMMGGGRWQQAPAQ